MKKALLLLGVALLAHMAVNNVETRTIVSPNFVARSDSAESTDTGSSGSSDTDSASGSEDTSSVDDPNRANQANQGTGTGTGANNNGNVIDAGGANCVEFPQCSSAPIFPPEFRSLFQGLIVNRLTDADPLTSGIADTYAETLRELLELPQETRDCSTCTVVDSSTVSCNYPFLVGSSNESPNLLLTVDNSAAVTRVDRIVFTTVQIGAFGRFQLTYDNPTLSSDSRVLVDSNGNLVQPNSVRVQLPGSNIFTAFSGNEGPLEVTCQTRRECGANVQVPSNPPTDPGPLFPPGVVLQDPETLRSVDAFQAAATLAGIACANNV